ncbi:MAG: hypothetical protein COB98_01970 [Flavobacteriaceae bacterium]|nr:MAG: hypothetical protein COB98_01970 [Flavobacteriaceae bacterium]
MNEILSPSNYSTLSKLSKQELIALALNQQDHLSEQKSEPYTLLSPILQDSLENMNESFTLVDNNGIFLYVNKAAEKLLGKQAAYLLGRNIWQEFPEKQGDLFFDNFYRAIDQNKNLSFKSYIEPWKIWLENKIIPSKYGVSMFFKDITDKVAKDKSKSEAYKFLHQSSQVSFIWLNKPGWPVEYVSENIEKLIGYSREDFILKKTKYASIVHPNDLENLKKQCSLRTGKQSTNNTFTFPPYRIIKKNGDIMWVSETSISHKNIHGETDCYRGVIKDITEQHKLKYSLDLITKSTAHITGKEFLDTICLEITKSLESDFTLIGFLNNNNHIVNTISVSNQEKNLNNFDYETKNTPCEITLKKGVQCIPTNVTKLFPKDPFLIDHKFEAYVGISLYDKHQKPIGIIVSLFKKPIKDEEFTKTIIQIFATRIAAEIESTKNRKKALRSQQEAWGLFDDAASPICIQDLSKVKLYFDVLKKNGVTDFMAYLHENPEELKKTTSLIKLKIANKQSLDLFNISDNNHLPQNLSAFLTPKAIPTVITSLDHLFKNKRRSTGEFPMLINGQEKTIIITAIIPSFSQKTYEKILFTFNDITEQRKTENLLKENRRRLQDQLDNTPLAAITWDLDFNCRSWNHSAEKIFGYSEKEAIGKNFYDLMHFEKSSNNKTDFLKHLMQGHNIQYTLPTITKQGASITTRWHVVSLKDAYNKITGSASLTQDITTEVEANKKIEISEKKYRNLFKKSNDPVLIFSNDLIIDYNKAALKALQVSKKNTILNKHVADISPKQQPNGKSSRKLSNKNHQKARDNGTRKFEWILKRSDHSSFPVEVSLTSIDTKEGNNILHAVFRDITDRKNAEKELKNALEKAKQSDKLKSAFLANMSHEIRTPMNGIIGFSELFSEPNLSNEDRKYYANIVINSSKQLLNIVNNILDISQIEAGMVNIKKEAVDLNVILSNTKAFFQGKADEKKITLNTYPGLNENFIIESDFTKIQQIINNLVSNALKFTDNGSIKIGYELVSNCIRFYIKDTGIGIEKTNKDKIFNRFTQADFDISTHFGGNGLGLSISQKLVNLLGGKIWVESIYTKGAHFFFTIPYKAIESEVLPQKAIIKILKSPQEITKKRTILIADDEIFNILFIKEVFSDDNFTIIEATNGKEAVEMCNKHHQTIDFVLMDVKMPIMNGLEATELIKKKHPQIPIIALSAYAMESDVNKALSYGCDDAISKPVNKKTLLSILDKYTGKD